MDSRVELLGLTHVDHLFVRVFAAFRVVVQIVLLLLELD